MHKIKKYIQNNKYLLLFLTTLFVFGIVSGLIIGISNIHLLKESVIFYADNIKNTNYNFILIHFFFFVISFVFSFLGIGIPLLCTILFYEGLTCGFLLGIFTVTYQLGGFFYAFAFSILIKGVYLLLLVLFFFKCLTIARKMIGKYLYKTDPSLVIVRKIRACAWIIGLLFLNDVVVFFLGNKILPLFHFLLS